MCSTASVPDRAAVNLRTMIVRQTQHLTRMVDDLLDVANLSRGKIACGRKPLS